jgi:hypothetical protein
VRSVPRILTVLVAIALPNEAHSQATPMADLARLHDSRGNVDAGDVTRVLYGRAVPPRQGLAPAALEHNPGSTVALAARWPSGDAGDLKFESSDFALQTFNRDADLVSTDMLPSGAYGPNKQSETAKGRWFIENQRWGAEAITAGIVNDDPRAIDRGLRIFEWGFAKQEKDGSFAHPAAFHSAAFFVEAVARSLLHLQSSQYRNRFQGRIDAMRPKLLLTAKWMLSPGIEEEAIKEDVRYTHRFYLNAAAMGFSGQLLQYEPLRAKAREYIQRGMRLQDESGFNPERGGPDTGYQGLGLIYAARYYSIEANGRLRPQLAAMATRATQWLSTKIRENGSVDSSSNTRTGDNAPPARDGKKKAVQYYSMYKSLAYWGLLLEQPSLIASARRIFERSQLGAQGAPLPRSAIN